MNISHLFTIAPPDRFGTNHTFAGFTIHPAQRYIFRVHPREGQGMFIPGVVFIAPPFIGQQVNFQDRLHFPGTRTQCEEAAAAHITQWKDGTWRNDNSPFISASYSISYVLFAAQRVNRVFWCSTTQISIIDTENYRRCMARDGAGGCLLDQRRLLQSLGGGKSSPRTHPADAVFFTAPLETFHALLPRWCTPILPRIASRELGSTQAVGLDLAAAARKLEPRQHQQEETFRNEVVERSMRLLRHLLSLSMGTLNLETHADVVDKISRFSAIFCWWPKWIVGTDPTEHPALLERVARRVQWQLQVEMAAHNISRRLDLGAVRTVRPSSRDPFCTVARASRVQ